MRYFIAIFAAVAMVGTAGPAMAADPLPEAGRTSLGAGSGPSLGTIEGSNGPEIKVHFQSGANGWRIWTPGAAPTATDPSTVPPESTKCRWGGPTMWCHGTKMDQGVNKAFAYAQVALSGTVHSGYQFFPPTYFGGRGLQDSDGDRAVIELNNGQLFLSEFDPISGTISPTNPTTPNISTATNPIEGRPVIHAPFVAWQALVGGVFQIRSFQFEPQPGTLVMQQPVLDIPWLSELMGDWVWFDQGQSVMNAFIGGTWDPGSALYDPNEHGCKRFTGLKGAEGDFNLVRGEDCDPWGASALFAILPGYSDKPRVFFVGELSAVAPEYEVYGRHIVYVDAANEVVWVEADPKIFDDYGVLEPDETNDNDHWNGTDVLTLTPGVVAKGKLDGGDPSVAGDDDKDFWALEVEQGRCYKVSSGLAGPGLMCYQPVHIADSLLQINDYVAPWYPSYPHDEYKEGEIDGYGTSECAIFELYGDNRPGSTWGTHYLEVIGDHYRVSGGLDYYLLATEIACP